MKIIKRLGIHVFLPLVFAFVVLFMLIAVPINARQYSDLEKEEAELQKTKNVEYKTSVEINSDSSSQE